MKSGAGDDRILTKREITGRLREERSRRIFVVPMVNERTQVGNGSLDLRLGTDFVITRRTRFSVIDVLEQLDEFQSKLVDYQENVYVDIGAKLILHPNQVVLGCTLEYLRLPYDLAAYVVGRSSWGRLGLVIATATFVHPGFTGVITLEMVNLGDAPIALYPGARIAQLVFHPARPSGMIGMIPTTKYSLSIRPSFTKIAKDEEWKILRRLKKEHDNG